MKVTAAIDNNNLPPVLWPRLIYSSTSRTFLVPFQVRPFSPHAPSCVEPSFLYVVPVFLR